MRPGTDRPAHQQSEAVMHQVSHTHPDGAASLLVAALEHVWQTIRTRHPGVPQAVLVVASGTDGKRLNLGHFAPHRWQVNGSDRHEVLVGGEGLHRGPTEVLGTLLHEAAHGLAQARHIQDTSRQGRYHNRRYATLARELGLEVASVKPIGWSATTVPAPTATAYVDQLESSRPLWCCGAATSTASAPAPAPATYSPPRARAVVASASPRPPSPRPILCARCQGPFQPDDQEL
jgi:hypothetical protein